MRHIDVIATLGLMLNLSKSPQAVTNPTLAPFVQVDPGPNFDRDVLKPLRQKQADEAAAVEAARLADLKATADRVQPTGTYSNSYAPLNCTWYVASRISVPAFMGNANQWDDALRALGWREGPPRVGAIAQTDDGWAGHVAIVEAIQGDAVLVSEYNFVPFSPDTRWANKSEFNYFY